MRWVLGIHMCSVDTRLPLVITGTRLLELSLSIVIEKSVDTSVWLKGVVWLLDVHVIVGTGTPVEVQEISTSPPSTTVTILVNPSLIAVLTSTNNSKKYLKTGYVNETRDIPGATTANSTLGGGVSPENEDKVTSYTPRSVALVVCFI